eukprot:6583992-Prorocentrum_lima.AAC.1
MCIRDRNCSLGQKVRLRDHLVHTGMRLESTGLTFDTVENRNVDLHPGSPARNGRDEATSYCTSVAGLPAE